MLSDLKVEKLLWCIMADIFGAALHKQNCIVVYHNGSSAEINFCEYVDIMANGGKDFKTNGMCRK